MTSLHERVTRLSEQLLDSIRRASEEEASSQISVKSYLQSLLNPNPNPSTSQLLISAKNLALAYALLASSTNTHNPLLSWIPPDLALSAEPALESLSITYFSSGLELKEEKPEGWDLVAEEKRLLLLKLMPEVLPSLKEKIKESSISKDLDGDEVSAASARAPVGFAILAAYQFRWFVTQVDYPAVGKLCALVVPCALTALDHWSSEVKGQGMITFIHLAKNVNAAELGGYGDVILDACCQNIASDDEIWPHVVEMSVLLVKLLHCSNPRSMWYERILNEMLSHLERQPRNKNRRTAWLKFIDPLLHGAGLVLLAHFGRLFPLFFQWMHADDEETVLLVLRCSTTVIRLTWIRNTPYVERLVDELVMLYKEAALRLARDEIRGQALEILLLLQQCKGLQFKTAWDRHREDPNLTTVRAFLSENTMEDAAGRKEKLFDKQGGLRPLITQ